MSEFRCALSALHIPNAFQLNLWSILIKRRYARTAGAHVRILESGGKILPQFES
jgi:hypothetical protein